MDLFSTNRKFRFINKETKNLEYSNEENLVDFAQRYSQYGKVNSLQCYIGSNDKNGKPIFEEDTLNFLGEEYYVKYDTEKSQLMLICAEHEGFCLYFDAAPIIAQKKFFAKFCEIISTPSV